MRVVIIGAGIVGAASAMYAARAGLEVVILDRGPIGSGTTSRGEGNILVSDKAPGPELDLALASRRLWTDLGQRLDGDGIELDAKGGIVVASSPDALRVLHEFALDQRAAGVRADETDPAGLAELEPQLSTSLPGGVYYPQDMQVQPVLAAHAFIADAIAHGARMVRDELAGAELRADGSLRAISCASGIRIEADAAVNAAGTWGGQVAQRLGGPIEVLPRRGFVLVTGPLPPTVRHKVYSADYVSNVASSDMGLETSCVVESTRGGTVLIGASRERVGFDGTMQPHVVAALARQAIAIFPTLRTAKLMRVYRGFRPYCPDHLPVVGPDPRVRGVLHACGHEGAGIGLAPATGALIAAHLTGQPVDGIDPVNHRALLPDRLLVQEMS